MTAVRLCKEPLLFCKSKSPFFSYFAFVPSLLCCLYCFLPCVRVWNKNVQFAPFLVTIIISTGFQNIVSSNKYFFFRIMFCNRIHLHKFTQYNLNINNQIFKYFIYLIVKWLYKIVLPYFCPSWDKFFSVSLGAACISASLFGKPTFNRTVMYNLKTN